MGREIKSCTLPSNRHTWQQPTNILSTFHICPKFLESVPPGLMVLKCSWLLCKDIYVTMCISVYMVVGGVCASTWCRSSLQVAVVVGGPQ